MSDEFANLVDTPYNYNPDSISSFEESLTDFGGENIVKQPTTRNKNHNSGAISMHQSSSMLDFNFENDDEDNCDEDKDVEKDMYYNDDVFTDKDLERKKSVEWNDDNDSDDDDCLNVVQLSMKLAMARWH